MIIGLERVSRPGRRRYVDHDEVPRVHGGMGTAIVTTSHGVMTGHEAQAEGRRRRGRRLRLVSIAMSRIGRKPIPVPEGVTVEIAPGRVAVKGPKGELAQAVSPDMTVEQADGVVTVARPTDRGEHRALHGLTRSLIANMVEGVTDGYEKRLEIQGVGYRAQLKGKNLELALGYSHPVSIERARRGSSSRFRSRPRSSCAGSTSSWSARSPPRSASAARPSPTRARASATSGEHVLRKVGKRA